MSLIKKIEEQSFYAFTGRINLLFAERQQLFGTILQKDGVIVNGLYRGVSGKNALYSLLLNEQFSEKKIVTIVEPEIINSDQIAFHLEFSKFKKLAQKLAEKYYLIHRLRPDRTIWLIAPKQKDLNVEVDIIETEILNFLQTKKRVKEVYEFSSYDEIEITIALVNLRKKGLLIKENFNDFKT